MKVRYAIAALMLGATGALGCAAGGSSDDEAASDPPAVQPEGGAADVSTEDAAELSWDSSIASDAGSDADAADAAEEDAPFCSGSGPIVEVGDTTTLHQACTGQIAASIFANAMCTCRDATFGGYLRTRGFNSGQGAPADAGAPDAAGEAGADGGTGTSVAAAPVGINGKYSAAGYTDISGAFEIAGTDPTTFVGLLTTADDFRAKADTTLVGKSVISGDGWLGGNLISLGPITFGGDLHHAGLTLAPVTVGGTNYAGPVTITPACDCDPAHLLNVAKIVQQGKQQNDNALIGLGPNEFSNVVGVVDVTLPCGRYYLSSINVPLGSLTIRTSSRIALFVDGDVSVLGVLNVDLTGGGELDLFASGTMHLTGTAGFGDKAHPAATRIYLGSSADVTLVGYDHFVGNLYAPKAKVYMPGYMKLYGSLFVGDYISGSYTDLLYDSAVQQAGESCPVPPPSTCTTCGVCTGGTACVNNKCGACTRDADCCGLMKCADGVCQNVIH